MDAKKGSNSGSRAAFTLLLEPGKVRVRKKTAPAGRPFTPAKERKPRRRPDWLAQAQDE